MPSKGQHLRRAATKLERDAAAEKKRAKRQQDRAVETFPEAEERRERDRERKRRSRARLVANAAAEATRRRINIPATVEASCASTVSTRRVRGRAPDEGFGGESAKVFRGIIVREEWTCAARHVLGLYTQFGEADDDVEGSETRFAYAFTSGEGGGWKVRGKHLDSLRNLEEVMCINARRHAATERDCHVNKVSLGLHTMFVRVYSGGPSTSEVVKRHTDTADVHYAGGQGKVRLRDERDVVSAVFVLAGGFSESGYDVRVFDRANREYYPQLETGDLLALRGGSDGVVHDVGFHGNVRAREVWKERLTVVAFFVVIKD